MWNLLRGRYRSHIFKIALVSVLLILLILATSFAGNFVLADVKLTGDFLASQDFPDIVFTTIEGGVMTSRIFMGNQAAKIIEERMRDKTEIVS